jgi:hypothetical protein
MPNFQWWAMASISPAPRNGFKGTVMVLPAPENNFLKWADCYISPLLYFVDAGSKFVRPKTKQGTPTNHFCSSVYLDA